MQKPPAPKRKQKENNMEQKPQVQAALEAAAATLELAGKGDPRVAAALSVLKVLRNLDDDDDLEIPVVSSLIERLREKRKKEK